MSSFAGGGSGRDHIIKLLNVFRKVEGKDDIYVIVMERGICTLHQIQCCRGKGGHGGQRGHSEWGGGMREGPRGTREGQWRRWKRYEASVDSSP